MSELNAEVWRNLVRLTSETLSPDMLSTIMSQYLHRPDDDLFKLTHDQAIRLTETLSPLPKLRKVLWEAAIGIVEPYKADELVAKQIDELAIVLLKGADFNLFPKGKV